MSVLTAPPRSSPATEVRRLLPSRLDGSTVEQVRNRLYAAMDEADGDLVLECGEVEVVDAAGLALVVGLHRRAHARGRRLVLADPPPRLLRVLAVTRLHRVLHLEREPVRV